MKLKDGWEWRLNLDDAADRLAYSPPSADVGLPAALLRTHTQNRRNHLPPETQDRRYTLRVIDLSRQPHADRIGA
jgi:hypothetical protein